MSRETCQKTPSLMTKVWNTIRCYDLILPHEKLVLAVSGGPDSIVMLDVLDRIRNDDAFDIDFDFVVAHVNHLIRDEASEDEDFVRCFCKSREIQFFSKSIDVKGFANDKKIGLEEAGRIARYEFFNDVLAKSNADKIAIAHNKNDKAETIIMNIFRGSGISGLKGIEYVNNIYVRPLLDCERYEIEQYCDEYNLNPRIDKTNFDNVYSRNRVRNEIIPYIQKEFNPNIIQTLSRLSDLVKQDDEFLYKLTEQKFRELCVSELKGEVVLDLKSFNKQEKVIKSRIVLYTITRLCDSAKGIEKVHVEDIIALCQKNIGNKFLTPNKNLKILVKNQKITFTTLP